MHVEFWNWWVLACALFVLEMLTPTGFVLVWIGAAAALVGLAAWLVPSLGWEVEAVMFGVLSIASFFVWRRFYRGTAPSDKPTLNRRGQSYVSRTFTLSEPIINGIGKLRVDDSQWRVSGPDVPAGTQVRVVSADGATLHVERA
jgi:membrane protein implicated in regulation of membrane protease activity